MAVAAIAEFAISFLQMMIVLTVSNHPRFNRLTGIIAGLMVAAYIAIEAPYSGMSMNPARTFGSALPSGFGRDSWCIFWSLPSPCSPLRRYSCGAGATPQCIAASSTTLPDATAFFAA